MAIGDFFTPHLSPHSSPPSASRLGILSPPGYSLALLELLTACKSCQVAQCLPLAFITPCAVTVSYWKGTSSPGFVVSFDRIFTPSQASPNSSSCPETLFLCILYCSEEDLELFFLPLVMINIALRSHQCSSNYIELAQQFESGPLLLFLLFLRFHPQFHYFSLCSQRAKEGRVLEGLLVKLLSPGMCWLVIGQEEKLLFSVDSHSIMFTDNWELAL